jgi:hypothetical protein
MDLDQVLHWEPLTHLRDHSSLVVVQIQAQAQRRRRRRKWQASVKQTPVSHCIGLEP